MSSIGFSFSVLLFQFFGGFFFFFSHVFVVHRLGEETDDDDDHKYDDEENETEVEVVYVLDDAGTGVLLTTPHLGVHALPDEASQSDDQADHQAPERALHITPHNVMHAGPDLATGGPNAMLFLGGPN